MERLVMESSLMNDSSLEGHRKLRLLPRAKQSGMKLFEHPPVGFGAGGIPVASESKIFGYRRASRRALPSCG